MSMVVSLATTSLRIMLSEVLCNNGCSSPAASLLIRVLLPFGLGQVFSLENSKNLVMLVRLLLLVVMSVLPPVSQAMQEGLGGDGWLVPWVTFFRCASILQITTESVSHSMLCQLSNQYFFGDLSRSCCYMIRVVD